jgi:hypothetical protein
MWEAQKGQLWRTTAGRDSPFFDPHSAESGTGTSFFSLRLEVGQFQVSHTRAPELGVGIALVGGGVPPPPPTLIWYFF